MWSKFEGLRGITRSRVSELLHANLYDLPTNAIGSRTFHYGGRSQNYTAMTNLHINKSPEISFGIRRLVSRWRGCEPQGY